MSETIKYLEKIDHPELIEAERKFIPNHPGALFKLKEHETTVAIEQIYLSTPDEPFSLRLRATASGKGIAYEATLKDRGTVEDAGLERLEVTAPISPELYMFYMSENLPVVRKLRAEPLPLVAIDFYNDGTLQVESEDEKQWRLFTEQYGAAFEEVTGLPEADNERRAFRGIDTCPSQELQAGSIMKDILAAREHAQRPVIVHIGGRSGSGKSTVVREVAASLDAFGISNSSLSTDDYHRGAAWLANYNEGQAWQHWDDPIVYDIKTMARDLQRIAQGEPVMRREIDWVTVEPRHTGFLPPAEVLLIEGIYATAPDITAPGDLVYVMPTPLATCVGRRLLRDMRERPQFADPVRSLAYMLAEAEPAYRRQHGSLRK